MNEICVAFAAEEENVPFSKPIVSVRRSWSGWIRGG